MSRPLAVWIVAPVAMPGSWPSFCLKVNRRSIIDSAITASIRANWSPRHLRGPPPKGMYAKLYADSFGYRPLYLPSYPGQGPWDSIASSNLLGLNLSASFQIWGDLWRFQTEMKRSVPFPILYPLGSPLMPPGRVSSPRALRMRIGGCGYSLRLSEMTILTCFISLMSSKVGCLSPSTASTSRTTLAISSGFWTRQWRAQVSTAPVVSCPAISIVIRSSRSCFAVASSPRMSTRNRSRLGSFTFL
mmetsp:Transcript_17868/g.36712  ORF Transcript_17868/g.36712 Transcript_17868/m.36712 type:complete len:245 (+) Transcript_17868:126-860(+)